MCPHCIALRVILPTALPFLIRGNAGLDSSIARASDRIAAVGRHRLPFGYAAMLALNPPTYWSQGETDALIIGRLVDGDPSGAVLIPNKRPPGTSGMADSKATVLFWF